MLCEAIREGERPCRYVGAVSDVPQGTADALAAWGAPSKGESRLPVLSVVAVAIFLQVILPDRLLVSGAIRILVPALEGLLLIVLLIANPGGIITPEQRRLRALGVMVIALISVANAVSLSILIHALLYGAKTTGRPLVYASVPIWLTNVIAFGLWYWELDRGGPAARVRPTHRRPDFLFPQMGARGSDPGCHQTSGTTCTRRSPMRRRSVRLTRCRSRGGRKC